MKNKVAVIGSYNMDIAIQTGRMPGIGETVLGKNIRYFHGGKGANQAVAAARAGSEVVFIGSVGADQNGQDALKVLRDEGINIGGVHIDDNEQTGVAGIIVNEAGENSIIVIPGANSCLRPHDIEKQKDLIEWADVVLLQLEIPHDTVEAAIMMAKSAGKNIILNPAPAAVLPRKLYENISVLTPNLGEAELLTAMPQGSGQAEKVCDKLLSYGTHRVMITMGDQGVLVKDRDFRESVPAYKVISVDSTGAGDVFNGVLACNYHPSKSGLLRAVSLATAAAGISVTREGAQNSIPLEEEIESFLLEYAEKY